MRHLPGHIRDTFLQAVEAYHDWVFRHGRHEEPPTVTLERYYVPRQITLTEACGLVWGCTDIIPGYVIDHFVADLDLPIRSRTYAAVARTMRAYLRACAPGGVA